MEPNKIIQKFKNEDGAALVMAMMVLMILSILGAMVGTLTVGSYRLSANNKDYNSAYYIAEAGANMAYEEIKEAVNTIYGESSTSGIFFESINDHEIMDSGKEYNDFEPQSGHTPTAFVTIDSSQTIDEDRSKTYTIQSVGEIDGKERIVEKTFQVNWKNKDTGGSGGNHMGLADGTAIFFNDFISFGNNPVDLTGEIIYFGSGDTDKINNVNVDVKPGENLDWQELVEYLDYLNNVITNEPNILDAVQLNDYELQTTTDSGSEKKTIIDTQGNTVNIILDTLDRSIEIINGGKVNLYIKRLEGNNNKYNLNTGKNSNPENLNIFFFGNLFELGQGSKVNGLLFAPRSTVNTKNSVEIKGSIIADRVMLDNFFGVTFPPDFQFIYPTPEDAIEEDPNESKELIEGSPALENNN